jgi:hypothetical protein
MVPGERLMGTVTECGLCGSQSLHTLLDMGIQPLAERFDDDTVYPLLLLECQECSLVQLGYQVAQHILFPPGHPYATGNTTVLAQHYARLAGELGAWLRFGDVAVDIGANDGTLLNGYGDHVRTVAVEPTNQAAKCREGGHRTWQAYFTPAVAADILSVTGPAKAVTACNVLAHVPDPHEAVAGIADLLDDEGVFVSENHDVHQVRTGQWDTVYHEHLRFWSPATFAELLGCHGLEVSEIRPVPTHGGSFRTYARKRVSRLGEAPETARKLRELLDKVTLDGSFVYGVGATTRAVPLICYSGIHEYLSAIVEVTGSEKIGHRLPGTEIAVIDEKCLIENQPAYALLLAWHLADFLIPKLKAAGYKGKFILPLPVPEVTGG